MFRDYVIISIPLLVNRNEDIWIENHVYTQDVKMQAAKGGVKKGNFEGCAEIRYSGR